MKRFLKASLTLLGLTLMCVEGVNAKGTVKIITEPGEAKIYVNGKRKGTSPAEKGQTFAIKLAEGEYVVEATRLQDDFTESYGTKDVFVADDTLQTVQIKLNKKRVVAAKLAELQAKYRDNPAPLPTMVTIPAGSFRMGCVSGRDCYDREKPVHTVNIKAFKLAATEVTFNQWDACVAANVCYRPSDAGWGRGNRPVINVSWDDVQVYLKWLNSVSDGGYRLPSEAEWEYAARAGSNTKYSWGNQINCSKAQYNGGEGSGCYYKNTDGSYRGTARASSYPANAFGLYDMHGNVREWVQDCWNNSYKGAPSNGSAWLSGTCTRRVLRGGSWYSAGRGLRAANRNWIPADNRYSEQGFRLAQDL